MDAIQVGLIGYGMAGRVFHAPVIDAVDGLRLRTIVGRGAAGRDAARDRYPWIEVAGDVADLLADQAIDLVVIATPNETHFELARAALLAGKHVVVDKPFTTTSGEARALIELARERGRLISVHHNRRWDGDFQTVAQVIAGGLLGRLVEYEAHYDRFRNTLKPNAWREAGGPGAGILFDLGSHLIDQALVLFGPPERLAADIRVQRDGAAADDQFELILQYPGLKVTLKAGMLVREAGPRFILHGSEGSFVKAGFDPQEEALKAGLSPRLVGWGQEPEAQWGVINTQAGGLHLRGKVETLPGRYQEFYANVRDAIAGAADLSVKPEDALATIRVIELARQSHAEGRTLPFAW